MIHAPNVRPPLPRRSPGRTLPWLLVGLLLAPLGPLAQGQEAREFLGVIYPDRDLTLSLGLNGVVDRVEVEVGESVTAGQPLLHLEAELQETEVARRLAVWEDGSGLRAEQARLEILSKLYEDAERLFEDVGSISGQELSQLRIEYVTVEGRVEQLRTEKIRQELEYRMALRELEQRTLAAPIGGVITELELDVGEWINPGDSAMRLVDASTCVLRVSVSEAAAYALSRGDLVPVRIEGLPGGEPVTGEVTFVSPVADAASGLVSVRVALDNTDGRIRPGAKARIRVPEDA